MREQGRDLTQSYIIFCMTKHPTPTEKNPKRNVTTQIPPPKTSITQRLTTDLGRSVGVTSHPEGVVKLV